MDMPEKKTISGYALAAAVSVFLAALAGAAFLYPSGHVRTGAFPLSLPGRDPASPGFFGTEPDVFRASWRLYRYRGGSDALVYASENSLLYRAVAATGLRMKNAGSIEDVLNADEAGVLVMSATPRNLRRLIELREQLETFQEEGGWVVLNGLEPDGLDVFNRLLNSDFIMRPFRVERVTVEADGSSLAESLSDHNLTLQSRNWIRGTHPRMFWLCHHTFSYMIDAPANIAPFTLPPGAPEDPFDYTPAYDDSDPYNFVNAMFASDFWRYIRQIRWQAPESRPLDLTFRLRRPETLDRISIWNNTIYSTIADIELIFDGNEDNAVKATLPNSARRTDIDLPEPVFAEETVTIRLLTRRVSRRDNSNLVGIDNVEFRRAENPPGVTALDSVGGLVAFPHGEGGMLLNQIKLMEREPNPANKAEKERLIGILLQNIGVGIGVPPEIVI